MALFPLVPLCNVITLHMALDDARERRGGAPLEIRTPKSAGVVNDKLKGPITALFDGGLQASLSSGQVASDGRAVMLSTGKSGSRGNAMEAPANLADKLATFTDR